MSTGLQGYELNYLAIDKQAYAIFKVVKQFRPYILKNRSKVIVPHLVVKTLFVQKEQGERRGNWVTVLQEYDLEFKPATIIKGQGLCKLMEKIQNNKDDDWENEAELHMINMCPIFTFSKSWYKDLIHYLQQGYLPKHWNSKQRRDFHLKLASYQIIGGVIFRKNYDGVFLRCLEQ